MGAAVGTDSEGSVNVELNVVPFIDLMSCLTAFLLVTAVWTNLAQISIKPKGIGQESSQELDEEEYVKCSLLITESEIWVGLSRVQDFRQIRKEGEEYNWKLLEATLTEHKKSSFLAKPNPWHSTIEIGAEDLVNYQTIVTAMDTALATGFRDVGLADPSSLTAKPQL